MATAVGIMDREGWEHNTDILVVVRPAAREVVWVPRDLYCACLDHRVNTAFKKGGHALLQTALRERGLPVEHSVCVLRSVVERALRDCRVTVPVTQAQEFAYPLAPQKPIEEGRKVVRFEPPEEILVGERFHQWLGARVPVEGDYDATSDLVRLVRQQTLLRRLLEERFAFGALGPEGIDASAPGALDELRLVRADWRFATLPDLVPASLRGMHLLVERDADHPWLADAS